MWIWIFSTNLGAASATSLRAMSYNLYGRNAMGTEAWKKPKLWKKSKLLKKFKLWKTIRLSQPDVLGVLEVRSGGLWKLSEKL